MNKREGITIIKPWKVTAGEHSGKWLAGVQWTEDGEQKDRQIDRPRSTFHEAQRDADTLARKIEAEGMQGNYPPLVTTQAREKADAEEVLRAAGHQAGSSGEYTGEDVEAKVEEAVSGLVAQRDAAEQQISDAIEAMHANGVDVSEGMVASVTTLAKAWRLLSETHNATVQESVEARAKAEKERDEALELKEVWRSERRNLEANLVMARKNLSAACEQREEAKRQRDKALAKINAIAKDFGVSMNGLISSTGERDVEMRRLLAHICEAVEVVADRNGVEIVSRGEEFVLTNLARVDMVMRGQRDEARSQLVKMEANYEAVVDTKRNYEQTCADCHALLDAATEGEARTFSLVDRVKAMIAERDEVLGMKRTDSAVVASLGQECEDLRVKVAEQVRVIAALHQALGDAFGLPDA